jgi:hypothetical protein
VTEPRPSYNFDSPIALSLAKQFSRLTRDVAFRQRLRECGWSPGMMAYLAGPGQESDVRARMDPGRHLLVAENPEQPFGLRMIVVEVDR